MIYVFKAPRVTLTGGSYINGHTMINLNGSEINVLRAFLENGVKFVVVGGRAVNFHGHLRPAQDLDVFYSKEQVNCEALLKVLNQDWGKSLTMNSLEAVVQIDSYGGPIQLHCHIDGVSFLKAYADRVFGNSSGVLIPFISCAHLIQNKRKSGRRPDRNKDIEDLQALQAICKKPGAY